MEYIFFLILAFMGGVAVGFVLCTEALKNNRAMGKKREVRSLNTTRRSPYGPYRHRHRHKRIPQR